MKTLWIYARHTTGDVDYLVLSGLVVVHPDGLSSGTTYTQPNDSGMVVAVHADRCEQGTPGRALQGQVVKTPQFTSVYLPEDVRKKLAVDAMRRYSKAFGGTEKFLRLIRYPNLDELNLPPVLREVVDAEARALARR